MTSKNSVVIRIDVEVYELLKKNAQPFERPNEVLRRLLGMKPPKPITRRTTRKG